MTYVYIYLTENILYKLMLLDFIYFYDTQNFTAEEGLSTYKYAATETRSKFNWARNTLLVREVVHVTMP